MGGGRQILKANVSDLPEDPIITFESCVRTDGRDLIAEWAQIKESEGARYAVVNNTKDLLNVDTSNTDFLLGKYLNARQCLLIIYIYTLLSKASSLAFLLPYQEYSVMLGLVIHCVRVYEG